MKKCPAKSTPRRRMSSTPNHSLVPSVARAAEEVRRAGTTPAATVERVFSGEDSGAAARAVLTTLADCEGTKADADAKTARTRRAKKVFIIVLAVFASASAFVPP